MRKGSDLIGKWIVAFDTGEEFEKIQDLIFDQNNNQLLGFVVDEGGWFSSARVLPLGNVQSIGPDAVIVPTKRTIILADSEPRFKAILERNNVLKGTKIMTTDGRDLGSMADLYFDEKTGVVEGYEASGGIFADAYTGRSFVPAPQTLKIGEDVAFVPPETAIMMEEQVGGIKGAVQDAADTVSDKASDAKDTLSSSLTNTAVDPMQQREWMLGKMADDDVQAPDGTLLVAKGQQVTPLAADEAERQGVLDKLYRATGGSLTAGVKDAAAGRVLEQAKGRRVMQPVRTTEGMIIAAPGQIVTEQVINRARSYHKESELLEATGLSTTDVLKNKLSGAGAGAQMSSQQAVANLKSDARDVKQGAANLWDRLKEKVSSVQDQAAHELEERRIRAALGRPTNRVILDPQDNVILNAGDLITHHAITMARSNGVLDMLLDSVADVQPEITPQSLRVEKPGEAALASQQRPEEPPREREASA